MNVLAGGPASERSEQAQRALLRPRLSLYEEGCCPESREGGEGAVSGGHQAGEAPERGPAHADRLLRHGGALLLHGRGRPQQAGHLDAARGDDLHTLGRFRVRICQRRAVGAGPDALRLEGQACSAQLGPAPTGLKARG
jgi:hypothetical protein